jgi:hypothetical protein
MYSLNTAMTPIEQRQCRTIAALLIQSFSRECPANPPQRESPLYRKAVEESSIRLRENKTGFPLK